MLVVKARADDGVQIRHEAELHRDLLSEGLRLRRGNGDPAAVLLEAPQQRRDAGVDLVFRIADGRKAFAIIQNRLLRLLAGHAADLHKRIVERRTDEHLELLLGVAGKAHARRRVQRRARDALFASGQRAVQIKEDRRILHLIPASCGGGRWFRPVHPALRSSFLHFCPWRPAFSPSL